MKTPEKKTSAPLDLVERGTRRGSSDSPYLRIFKSNVYVRDLARSVSFYVDQLGFSVLADGRFEFGRWIAVAPPDGSTILALLAPKRNSDNYKLIGRPTNIGFITEDINATYELWLSRGVHFSQPPQSQLWGGTFARFCDPDKNAFELIASDEMSRDIEAQRRAIAEKAELERRTAQELEIAKQVQARLFPQTLPAVAGLDYAGVCIQARHVGGDYYDFLALGQERLGLLIGDISGKGMAAALLMANLQANLRSQFALAREQPHLLLRSVNELFYQNTADSSYATFFYAEYDGPKQRLRYTNCGHLAAILLRQDDTLEMLHSTGTVLGLFKDWDGPTVECQMHPGDMLALYTDGVTESFNEAEEEFGEARLIEALRRHRAQPAQAILALIVEALRRFSSEEQHDDITLIVAKCSCD
ncbi:Serine phosphatase RsbU, regulator of sigma subunit [Acidisarcina polymorpha]|uniref:Serine phosphatase RsbU, regulator of sigma subunit n=1 Tax=Acidisarcina polymorpha TaxID=2211140 RepID=A0A2Z5FW07_9BACT|nr:SpoIIE family protein phosphatase [Acidisarcina polymorpha]AXC10596.1 Serine phosphatase RsbU, regulator of sigma subunit [Acidisarcina polymorpha]